jgi:heme-degrading monooxygenase HmoA
MPLISITRLRVRSLRFFPIFVLRALQASGQAATAEGNLKVAVLRDRHMTFWTSTCWSSEAAMKAFMHAGVHGSVMRRLLEWCDEAALVHWMSDAAVLPSWEEAHTRLQRDGRRSKVNHPSRAHVAYEIEKPTLGVTRERLVK